MSAYNEQDSGFAGLGYGIDKRVETAKCGESAGTDFGPASNTNPTLPTQSRE